MSGFLSVIRDLSAFCTLHFACKQVTFCVQSYNLYGLVINAHIKNSYGDAMNIVAIFKLKTHEFNIDEFTADYSKLMLFPIMVARNYWTSGFFYNVGQIDDLGNVPSYGFYHHYRVHKFWNEYGEKINEQPDYLASGATTIIGVGYKVNKEIIIDKSLLK